MSIKQKILLFVLLPIYLAFALIKFFDFQKSQENAIEQAKISLREKSMAYANRIDSLLNQVGAVATTTARVLSVDSHLSQQELYGLLQKNVADNPLIYGAAIAFEPGVFEKKALFSPYVFRKGNTTSQIDIGAESYDYTKPEWDWYALPKKLNAAVWTEPYFDLGAGNIQMVTFSVPFYRNGQLAGITTIDLDLSRLPALAGIAEVNRDDLFLLSKGGLYVFHHDPAQLGKSMLTGSKDFTKVQAQNITRTLNEDTTSIVGLDESHGVDSKWIASAPVNTAEWRFISKLERATALKEVNHQFSQVVLQSLIVLALTILSSLFFVSRILNPIGRLAKAARDVIDGKDYYFDVPQGKDEVVQLARDFSVMAQRLQERAADLALEQRQAMNQVMMGLRQAKNLEEMVQCFMHHAGVIMGVRHGLLYLVDQDRKKIRILGGYGISLNKTGMEFSFGEGLAGQCAQDRMPIMIKQPPADYMTIVSGTGASAPQAILLRPLVLKDELVGILELATLNMIEDADLSFLDETEPVIAANIKMFMQQQNIHAELSKVEFFAKVEHAMARSDFDIALSLLKQSASELNSVATEPPSN